MPKVSICIPTYKQVAYLKKTLSSVLEQTFTDYELIITDDSADDSVKNLLREFDFKNKLKYFKNPVSLGSPANWNFSIQNAVGEHIKILHHDDYFTTNKSLEEFIKLLDSNPHASLAFSGTTIDFVAFNIKKTHNCSEKKLMEIIKNPAMLFLSNYIGAPSATIFRNTKKIEFDVNLKWLVDVDWYIQMIQNNPKIINTKETLICTVHGSEGQITQAVSAHREIQIAEHVYLFNKIFDKIVDFKNYTVFFQLLFHKYQIKNLDNLKSIVNVSEKAEPFFNDVFQLKNDAMFFKRVNYWLKKKTVSDYLFTFKTLFR